MKTLRNLTMACAVGLAAAASAATPDAPLIMHPSVEGARMIRGLSNNGLYGVAAISPEESGYSYHVGAILYDLTDANIKSTDLSLGKTVSAAYDVTDDGTIVVGTVDMLPAYCKYADGKWTWITLPIPDISYTVKPEFADDSKAQTFKLNGGQVQAVTPDGKYAVGLVRSNENELLEKAVMWDLSDNSIIEVNSPVETLNGQDHHMSRYIQLSNDGRYLLCNNGFSYGGVTFVYDREKEEAIYIDVYENEEGRFVPRVEGYRGLEMDGFSKALTSDGHYVTGSIGKGDDSYIFVFDVYNKELKVFDKILNTDVTAFTMTKDGLPLVSSPAVNPYCFGFVLYDDFLFPFESLYKDVYQMSFAQMGIDTNTGKPTQVSDDGRTIVFITSAADGYVARFKEDLRDAIAKVNLMNNWSVSPVQNSKMTVFTTATFTFDFEIEVDPSKYNQIKLLDSKGSVVANPLPNGGVVADGQRLSVNFRGRQLNAGEEYTLSIPAGVCWVKGRETNVNNPINVKYVGRADDPVKVVSVSPKSGSTLPSLDINDNPLVVTFDVPVIINGTSDNRPIAHLYIDGSDESAASLGMDVDINTGRLVIYPVSTVYLYKGSEYTVKVPAGAVTDISGRGPSEAFEISYTGSYAPQLGDDVYLFRSTCDDYANLLFYEGDKGTPVPLYESLGFTADSTPWYFVREDEATEDMAFGSHSCYVDGRQSDDWMVIRQLNLPSDVPAYMNFQSQSYKKNATDRLKVYVYEHTAAINLLTKTVIDDIRANGDLVYDEIQSPGATEEGLSGEWTDNTISLEKYKGKNIYICFVNDNKNQSMVMVDNIEVVKEVKAFITVTGHSNVVNLASVPVKGILSVESDLVDYSTLSMSLLDSEGKEISSISESGLSLKKGDSYNFEFPKELPLVVGEENPYTINYTLDDDALTFNGSVRDLAFQPVKKVVVEEFTGRTCPNCPLGILAMELLESRYPDQVIPVGLYAYGNDPKGAGMYEYAQGVFNYESVGAPSGRVNRRNLSYPMFSAPEGVFHFTKADVEGAANVWMDEVLEEFNEPAFLDVTLKANDASSGRISYTASVKSAISLTGQNIRVLGVVLEDGLIDYQDNNLYVYDDETLGEFGRGGRYGSSVFYYTFNNVARGYWGQSSNGYGQLIPNDLKAGQDYDVDIDMPMPSTVSKPQNTKFAVMLIDGNNGRIVNASVQQTSTGVGEIADELGGALAISKSAGEILIESAGEFEASVYTLDGRILKSVRGAGTSSFSLDGYNGMVIVKAVSGSQTATQKLLM